MRLFTIFTGAAALLSAQSWAATPIVRWSTGAPGPVSQLKLPMTFHSAPNASGIYFAYYTTLESGSRPYAGFQPKPLGDDGKPRLQAVFSSFHAEATTADTNCQYGADGGPGVSCAVQFAYKYNTTYTIILQRASASATTQLMIGDVFNNSTGSMVAHIGSFRLPIAVGRFKPSDQGFLEPYQTAGCEQQVELTYGLVTGIEEGTKYTGSPPTVTDPESGSCLSTSSKVTEDGTQVTVIGNSAVERQEL